MISLKNVDVHFRKFHALKSINLEISKGERVAIIGSNGAGKSTLIDVIVGANKKIDGSVSYSDPNFKSLLGVQFQSKDYPPGLKVKDLLNFYLKINMKNLKDERVISLLKKFSLSDKLNVQIRNLSGGQQQKLNILISILNDPETLIVDEVTTALDVTSKNDVINTLKSIIEKTNITLILVSHSSKEIELLANRVLVMKTGKIVDDLTTKDINKKFKSIENFISKIGELYE